MSIKSNSFIGGNKLAFGIDLGTTNSAISVVTKGNQSEIINLGRGKVTLPSCVMLNDDGTFTVGDYAYKHRYLPNVAYSVKRLMGSNQTVTLRNSTGEHTFRPCEISAEVLRELAKRASKLYGIIEDVVITIPAYFNDTQIKETLEAGKLAGLNVLGVMREPTSACLNYSLLGDQKDKMCLVYDLGGGTFDISLVKIQNPEESEFLYKFYDIEMKGDTTSSLVMNVIKVDGSTRLGGDDIDLAIYKQFSDAISEKIGIDFDKYVLPQYREELILRMESLKKFSDATSTVEVETILQDGKDTHIKEKITVTPNMLASAAREIYDKTAVYMKNVMMGVPYSSIDEIILVGGSTKLSLIKKFLSQDFPNVTIQDGLNPDEAVALGAGVQAKLLKNGDQSIRLVDVLPLAIGIESVGRMSKLIDRNQPLPCKVTRSYTTVRDGQDVVQIEVYQGNSVMLPECSKLGTLVVDGLPNKKAGEVNVHVTFSVDINGTLTVEVDVEGRKVVKELKGALNSEGVKDVKSMSLVEKKILRWSNLIPKYVEGQKLQELLIKFADGEDVEKDIIKFIKTAKQK